MIMKIMGQVDFLEDKVSKKGNKYTIIRLRQEDVGGQYFNTMVDFDLSDREDLTGKKVELTLEYNARFRSFKAVGYKYL